MTAINQTDIVNEKRMVISICWQVSLVERFGGYPE